MDSIDPNLFIETIISEGSTPIDYPNRHDSIFQSFLSRDGSKKVIIDVSEDFIMKDTAIIYLEQLGMSDIIEPLFPLFLK